MRKCFIWILAAAILFSGASLMAAGGEAGKAKNGGRKYVIAFMLEGGQGMEGQIRAVITEAEKTGFFLETVVYNNEKDIIAAAKNNKFDLAFLSNDWLFHELSRKYGHEVFLTVDMLNLVNPGYCLYTGKNETANNIGALRGKNIVTYNNFATYIVLRNMLEGKPPEDYFGVMKSSPDPISSMYALGLGEADCALVFENTFEYMKTTNPGPIKGVRKISCSPYFPTGIFTASKDAPEELKNEISRFLMNFGKYKSLKKYKSLISVTKIKFRKVTGEDFEPALKLIDEGIKKGWKKDYDRWMKLQK